MRLAIESFRGEVPRVSKRLLPENAGSEVINARLQSGDLQSWRQFSTEKVLANGGDVQTIYLLNDKWLSWEADVDVARGPIPGDNTYRTYLTGPDIYDQPRFTNYALATGSGSGPEPYPITTRPLGVPAPDSQPTCAAGVSTLNQSNVDIIDNGDTLTNSWTTSPQVPNVSTVSQDAAVGNGAPSYSLTAINNTDDAAWLFRNFGISGYNVVEISFDFIFNSESIKRMLANVMADDSGAGIFVNWGESGVLNVGIAGAWSSFYDSVLASSSIGVPTNDVVYTCAVTIVRQSNGNRTVTASIYQGSAQIGGSVTAGNRFLSVGDNIGFILHVGAVPSVEFKTHYDNIAVRASGVVTTDQEATSYVYTFVNDLGEESAPSLPSSTILKDDGTAITVTTATAVQSGYSVDYTVETKRIYRAVSGSTGTVFKFVAEIPISQADYVDELTDSELGDTLETDLYALPPDDLKGILALPNGVMVGFRRNQLCFSAQGRPHAWPVEWRLNTDTDIVGIGNIDTTVVIGTKSFPYLAIGNDPSAYSMTKLEVPQAAISKRSFAYLIGIGVVFASPDGLIAVSGNGSVRNLTETMFTRRQWRALLPASIVGVAHDDVYHFWYNTEDVAAGGTAFTFNITPHDLSLTNAVSYVAGPATTSATCVPLNAWTLIELRRDASGLVELLANDVVRASQSGYNANVGSGQRTYDIGSFDNDQEFFVGYIDRVRVTEGGVSKLSVDFNGPNGSTTFTDSTGSSLTAQGSVAQSNAQAYDGSFSANFSAGSSNIASSRLASPGTGRFSLSAAVYPTAYVPVTGGRVISAQDVISIDPVLAVRVSSIGRLTALLRDPSGNNLLVLTSSDAVAGPIADMTASSSVSLGISSTGTVPPGLTLALVWDGTSGTVTIAGTPTTPGTYNFTVTYTNTTTSEVLGTSSHQVVVT